MPLLCTPNTSITYKEAKAEVRKLLIASVKRRLVADREVCVYLSGSVDSTIICGIISSLGHPLTSVTMGFGDHPLSEEGKPFFHRGGFFHCLDYSQTPQSKPHNTTLSSTKE